MKNKILLSAFIIITGFCHAEAAILHVPADYATIQQAIDASANGDTVLVDNGEYIENINLHDKNILLTSNYYTSGDYADIETTIINGSSASGDTASVILIISGEDSTCIVQGFTITGGKGTKWLDEYGAGTYREGGGLLIQYSSPVIQYNIIRNNLVNNNTGADGTGGGAIRCGDSNLKIKNNIIVHNEGKSYGGGLVFNYCPNALVQNNLIAFNTGGEVYGGGGIWMTGSSSAQTVNIINNTIAYNSVNGSGTYGGRGGGVFIFSVTAMLMNNIICANDQVSGNTVYNAGGIINASYCDIDAAIGGEGMINADPLFLDTAMCFLIDTLSPCVDAGNPEAMYSDPPSDLLPGQTFYPSFGTVINDMGVYGGPERMQISDCPPVLPADILLTDKENIIIYPNPASEYIVIKNNNTAPVSFNLYNTFGRIVLQKNDLYGTETIELNKLPLGVYFYQMAENQINAKSGSLIIN